MNALKPDFVLYGLIIALVALVAIKLIRWRARRDAVMLWGSLKNALPGVETLSKSRGVTKAMRDELISIKGELIALPIGTDGPNGDVMDIFNNLQSLELRLCRLTREMEKASSSENLPGKAVASTAPIRAEVFTPQETMNLSSTGSDWTPSER
jgi:hypothetical protein